MNNRIAELDFQIEQLRPRARAEAAIATVLGKRKNPWAGAADAVAALEHEREDLRLRIAGEDLAVTIGQYAALVDEITRAERQLADARELAAENAKEASGVLARYRRAPAIASKLEFGHAYQSYHDWVRSSRGPKMRIPYEYPQGKWPKEILFDDADRDVIRHTLEVQSQVTNAINVRQAVLHRQASLQREHPELIAIDSAVLKQWQTPKS